MTDRIAPRLPRPSGRLCLLLSALSVLAIPLAALLA